MNSGRSSPSDHWALARGDGSAPGFRVGLRTRLGPRTREWLWISLGITLQILLIPLLVFFSVFMHDSPTSDELEPWAIAWVPTGGPVCLYAVIRGVMILRSRPLSPP